MKVYLLIITVSISILPAFLQAQTVVNGIEYSSITDVHYDVLFKKKDIGDIKKKILVKQNQDYTIIENSAINMSSWWGKLSIYSQQIEQFLNTGKLLRVDLKAIDSKDLLVLNMENIDNTLHTSIQSVKKLKKEEAAEVRQILYNNSANNASLIETKQSQNLFQSLIARSKEIPIDTTISQNDYDTTLNHLPFYWLNNNRELPEHLRIFDSEELSVYEMQIKPMGVENTLPYLANQPSNHYRLTPPKGKPMDIWLTSNNQDIAYFSQLIGEDQDGPFHIKLKKE